MGKSASRWVEFTRDYDYRHISGSITAYKLGMRLRVLGQVADAAIKAGAAIKSSDPKKNDDSEGEVFLNG